MEDKKASLRHGEWLPWLRDHFEGSERHAQRFMKLAREQRALDPTRVSDLSLRGALRELPSNAPSGADRIADEWEWDDEDRREFAALPEREKAILLRSNLLFKYMHIGDDSRMEHDHKVLDHLDRLDGIIKPVDLPEGSERRFCENFLTYRQMHETIEELMRSNVVQRTPPKEAFEDFMSRLEEQSA